MPTAANTAYRTALKSAKRPSKYGAVRQLVDGHNFASKREANRWQELKLMERSKQIHGLKRQHKMRLDALVTEFGRGGCIGHYIADFAYYENGEWVLEDAKGVLTQLYTWKKKHVLAQYGIKIREV